MQTTVNKINKRRTCDINKLQTLRNTKKQRKKKERTKDHNINKCKQDKQLIYIYSKQTPNSKKARGRETEVEK